MSYDTDTYLVIGVFLPEGIEEELNIDELCHSLGCMHISAGNCILGNIRYALVPKALKQSMTPEETLDILKEADILYEKIKKKGVKTTTPVVVTTVAFTY